MKLYKEMRDRMIKFFAKWLPIFFGCHCIPERSFFIKGKQFPICSRCTGILVGIFLAICTFFFVQIPIYYLIIMTIPMIIDGSVQAKTKYESNNKLRFFTGLLFGYAGIQLSLILHLKAINYIIDLSFR